MLSSISLGSIDNLENSRSTRLTAFVTASVKLSSTYSSQCLCDKCQPAFSETFKKTQSTPLLLKVLCEPCKISYIKDKRSVSRKKPKPEKQPVVVVSDDRKQVPAKKRPIEHSRNERQKIMTLVLIIVN